MSEQPSESKPWDDHETHLKAHKSFAEALEAELKATVEDLKEKAHEEVYGKSNHAWGMAVDVQFPPVEKNDSNDNPCWDVAGTFFYQPPFGLKIAGHLWHTLKQIHPSAPEFQWHWEYFADIDVYALIDVNEPKVDEFYCFGGPLHGTKQTMENMTPVLLAAWPPELSPIAVSELEDIPPLANTMKVHQYRLEAFKVEIPYRVERAGVTCSCSICDGKEAYTVSFSKTLVASEKWNGDLQVDYAEFTEQVWVAEADKARFMDELNCMVALMGIGLGLIGEVTES